MATVPSSPICLSPSPVLPAPSELTQYRRVGRYLLSHTPIAGSSVVHAVDEMQADAKRMSARPIPVSSIPSFLATEGLVRKTLTAHPHPNVAPVLATVEPSETTDGCIVLPAIFGDLHTTVRFQGKMLEPQAKSVFSQVARAVAHCHRHNIILRDMKLSKFAFVDEDKTHVSLVDLDGSQCLSSGVSHVSDQKGSPAYVAPEVLLGKPYDGRAADVWSLGVILYVLLVGTHPFQDVHPARLFQKIVSQEVVFPAHVGTRVRAFVESLLQKNASLRPSAEEVLSHPWLNQVSSDSSDKSFVSVQCTDEPEHIVPGASHSSSSSSSSMPSHSSSPRPVVAKRSHFAYDDDQVETCKRPRMHSPSQGQASLVL